MRSIETAAILLGILGFGPVVRGEPTNASPSPQVAPRSTSGSSDGDWPDIRKFKGDPEGYSRALQANPAAAAAIAATHARAERANWQAERKRSSRRAYRPQFGVRLPIRSKARPPQAAELHVGDAWGCAKLLDGSTYCWQAPYRDLASGKSVIAQHVAWLDDRWLGAGPDRICIEELGQYRCWRAPEFLALPRGWSLDGPWAGAGTTSWQVDRNPRGATIDTVQVMHGAWRGCSPDWCWSPKQAPTQLNICRADPLAAPCDITRDSTLTDMLNTPTTGDRIVGDLFACSRFDGLRCVGASRDGFFGTREECPKDLFNAWPTSDGPVSAPNAKCSRLPVQIGGSKFLGNAASAGPRGLCLEDVRDGAGGAQFACIGAVPNITRSMNTVVVGLGNEPSACGYDDAGRIFCWGAGYGASGTSSVPVPIQLDIPGKGNSIAWQGKGTFHANCLAHRKCGKVAEPLPACAPEFPSVSLEQLLNQADALEDRDVTVHGRLVFADVASNWVEVACGPYLADGITPNRAKGGGNGDFCCLEAEGPIAVADSREYIALEGMMCSGDQSRVCCNIPVLGQKVAATGRLTWTPYARGIGGPTWVLRQPQLCERQAK